MFSTLLAGIRLLEMRFECRLMLDQDLVFDLGRHFVDGETTVVRQRSEHPVIFATPMHDVNTLIMIRVCVRLAIIPNHTAIPSYTPSHIISA